ncbi:hypothetical protein ABLB69_18295 [Xenorhabdus khoisanae]|uniref:hypothetical protein n=1 Tax=Xenorhabdus khoisanae TaxID=880157 RepID=UPI0032B77C40
MKTEGYSADFTELYAILRLQIIANSIHIISGKKVNILVLTGGNRFHEALFTHEEKIKKYDEQRSLIAKFFSDQNASIAFRLYKNNINDSKLKLFSEKIDIQEINKNFKVILVNIDWSNILSDYKLNCHNIGFPDSLSKHLNNGGDKDNIIIMAIVSILRNDTHKYWIEKIDDVELFDDTINYFREVTKQSVIKYLSIHLIDRIENNGLYDDYIRLTVHIKSDRNDIPAVYNLGRLGGNKPSQHVCFSIINGVVNFTTILEMHKNKNIKKYFPPEVEGMLFHWLHFEKQPLLYSDNENLLADILSTSLIKI